MKMPTAISMGEIMRSSTLQVEITLTGVRWYAFRLWLGMKILQLAARVIGCGIEFKGPPQPGPRRRMPTGLSGYQPTSRCEGEPLPPPRYP